MTAEEFLIAKSVSKNPNIVKTCYYNADKIVQLMTEFAKYHVQEAIQSIEENVSLIEVKENGEEVPFHFPMEVNIMVDFNTIREAYPLEEIK